MHKIIRIFLLFLLISFSLSSHAEIRLTNALAKDIGQSYGFYVGQTHSLDVISNKYPSMASAADIARRKFSLAFGSSIDGMSAMMENFDVERWNQIKKRLDEQIEKNTNANQISKYQAQQFIAQVLERAKGNIDSPVIETYLMFKSGYQENPEREFIDGFRKKYSTNGDGKAKGIAFMMEMPKSWVAKEANRPNIVQKFISKNGKGSELFMILTLDTGQKITESDISEILNQEDMQSFLPENTTYLDSGKLTLENLPGYWIRYKMDASRVRTTGSMEIMAYNIFHGKKLIQFQGQVITSINGTPINNGGISRYEELFDLMVNSFVLPEIYK
ncbi:hypothetical protein C0W96_02095 [Photobacterium kishitanii]|uniref:hypothetical protein n=1 Tax=Photobacterium kishitanii TaxID=318456 RepID=UPI0005D41475|nr:hypothetical protein [Photobacterium kishitanii]KJG10730.1 hypothetical protein UB40_05070 [Photobacterium kishitanii]PSV08067.1 hypothetical protein C0W96_02095 [Photobacterium kishitanii]PSV75453.1 hypothetical protein C0W29_11325 [Photobacterium kishitanii]